MRPIFGKQNDYDHEGKTMKKMNRRTFLKTTAVTAAMTSPLLAIDSEKKEDYKALVCILLEGGADTVNMVVPKFKVDAYKAYRALRGDITPSIASLRTLAGSRYGLHPQMPKMQRMFNYRDLAVVTNVGTLIHPVTKAQIEHGNKHVELPLGLFSQMAQQNHWMMSGHDDKGWAGAVADALAQPHTNVSVGGHNVMQHSNTYETLMAFEDDKERSLEEQLEKVATLLASRKELQSPKRQIFFVRHTGWDTHQKSLDEMQKSDAKMITELDNALDRFATRLTQLKLDNSVTTFTMFDTSRITSADMHGLNYGWGGHAFVMGGAVKAGIHGMMPNIEPNSKDMLPNTALIPTISTDQYLSTMVNWLCDGKIALHKIFPNLKHFEAETLQFMI
ncbi:hypothetical protein MNB_SV-8-1258 [hydrothermal vent metagenome]|uniref:Tat (Twin-arginine translocation) pathway signal sequence domain protein n=1 Tax=hydrothermal vent metagenome TaxID=652676 RepID=A0A1W1C818_9ZZZZ